MTSTGPPSQVTASTQANPVESGPSVPRRPGRPRSERARQSVLRATWELLSEVGLRAMTTDRIAERSGVSKATIYKWWPSKYAVAVDAFLSEMSATAPAPDAGSALEDFRLTLRGLMRFYAGASGGVFAQLVAEAQTDPAVAAELRDHLVAERRAMVAPTWDRGVARGELSADLDPDVGLDLIFGPAMYRLMAGHAPLTDDAADAIVEAAMRGLAPKPRQGQGQGPAAQTQARRQA
ncbi:AcrR family transcriptional regulator [Catenulispora sp. GP43]|uniref:TetR/AcrR family transcriptional regulator n=1 Tax=Catenulispora sp. GP43 TaxID=3156263 RepID=UPI003519141B